MNATSGYCDTTIYSFVSSNTTTITLPSGTYEVPFAYFVQYGGGGGGGYPTPAPPTPAPPTPAPPSPEYYVLGPVGSGSTVVTCESVCSEGGATCLGYGDVIDDCGATVPASEFGSFFGSCNCNALFAECPRIILRQDKCENGWGALQP